MVDYTVSFAGKYMKVCKSCCCVNPDEAETCIQCGGDDFDELLMTPFYDDEVSYLEE